MAEQWPDLFKIDAGAEAQAIERAKPDGIYNVTFGSDLAKFVRDGGDGGLLDGRNVYARCQANLSATILGATNHHGKILNDQNNGRS